MATGAQAQLPAAWRELIIEALAPFEPRTIMVFGSRARGFAHDGSDVDLLVVLDHVEDPGEAALAMRRALSAAQFAKDVVATDTAKLARRGDAIGSVYRRALREGAVIYGVDDRDAKTWLRYAQEDLDAATAFAEGRGFAPRVACYHAQQAAEKALKAVLVADGREPVLTHDLRVLADLVPSTRRVAGVEADLGALSQWNVRGRYPGDWGEATEADAHAAIESARAVVEAAQEDLVDSR